jgi:hypothetical protein
VTMPRPGFQLPLMEPIATMWGGSPVVQRGRQAAAIAALGGRQGKVHVLQRVQDNSQVASLTWGNGDGCVSGCSVQAIDRSALAATSPIGSTGTT